MNKKAIINKLLLLGGWVFWIYLITTAFVYVLKPYTQIECYNEVTQRSESPEKNKIAEVRIRDCVGGTSDYFGTVSLSDKNSPEESTVVFEFNGTPDESGLSIEWESKDTLLVKMKTIKKANRLVRYGNDVKVKFEITK
ncbi:hypothetical protein [Rheinheimera sp.]|uniref:hypothetical protein n=1 Tax=Rheinheimera sp. TaxID=1869214 RepID=UPI00262DCEF4|nr:hypothetical protein [Rheinheimera sp.]MCA1928819.1 hypothetical protein [Rheinheimera sp.]